MAESPIAIFFILYGYADIDYTLRFSVTERRGRLGRLLAFEEDASDLHKSPNRQIPLSHITSQAILLESEARTAELL